jgi:hypothetical protein
MTNIDHQRRAARIARGERNVTDLDRLFGDLRFAKPGRSTVTEIGDFAAHREERDKGITMNRAAEMQTSARIWVRQLLRIPPSFDEAGAAGLANLKIASDAQIKEALGVPRETARSRFIQGMNKLRDEKEKDVTDKERAAINYLGTSFIWLYAFDDKQLIGELADVLIETGALAPKDRAAFADAAPFVALHALTLLHRARLRLPDGSTAPLRLSVRPDTNTLWIKVDIPVEDIGKPIGCRIPVFETSLDAASHCAPELLDDPAMMEGPIEIGSSGQLVAIA